MQRRIILSGYSLLCLTSEMYQMIAAQDWIIPAIITAGVNKETASVFDKFNYIVRSACQYIDRSVVNKMVHDAQHLDPSLSRGTSSSVYLHAS